MNRDEFAFDEIQRCASVLRTHGHPNLLPHEVTLSWSLRGSTRSGAAEPARNRILLSPALYEAVGDAYRKTIAHEYAHLVVRLYERTKGDARSRPHGPRWQRLMRLFGYTPDRCSNYGVSLPGIRKRAVMFCQCSGRHKVEADGVTHAFVRAYRVPRRPIAGQSCSTCGITYLKGFLA